MPYVKQWNIWKMRTTFIKLPIHHNHNSAYSGALLQLPRLTSDAERPRGQEACRHLELGGDRYRVQGQELAVGT